jgi:hypothetical protein
MVLVGNKLTSTYKWIGGLLAVMFVLLDASWCKQAYRFEFLGEHSFADIQNVNYAWFWYTLVALRSVVVNSRLTITQSIDLGNSTTEKPQVAETTTNKRSKPGGGKKQKSQ